MLGCALDDLVDGAVLDLEDNEAYVLGIENEIGLPPKASAGVAAGSDLSLNSWNQFWQIFIY